MTDNNQSQDFLDATESAQTGLMGEFFGFMKENAKWWLLRTLRATSKQLERVSKAQLRAEFQAAGISIRRIIPDRALPAPTSQNSVTP